MKLEDAVTVRAPLPVVVSTPPLSPSAALNPLLGGTPFLISIGSLALALSPVLPAPFTDWSVYMQRIVKYILWCGGWGTKKMKKSGRFCECGRRGTRKTRNKQFRKSARARKTAGQIFFGRAVKAVHPRISHLLTAPKLLLFVGLR